LTPGNSFPPSFPPRLLPRFPHLTPGTYFKSMKKFLRYFLSLLISRKVYPAALYRYNNIWKVSCKIDGKTKTFTLGNTFQDPHNPDYISVHETSLLGVFFKKYHLKKITRIKCSKEEAKKIIEGYYI